MPLTNTRALLAASCVCFFFGIANVNADRDKMQPGQEVQGGKPPSLTRRVPSRASLERFERIKKRTEPQNYSLPIVSKDGVLYYDVAGVEDEEIFKNAQSVKGITASKGGCKLRSLYLGITYLLDEDLITNCPRMSLTLKGKDYRCVQEGQMLQRKGVAVDMSQALCNDVWHDNATVEMVKNDQVHKYGMKEGIQKLEEFGITNCSDERCSCKWYFKGDDYSVNVDCEGAGLTDDTLPTLPNKVKDVRMENNALRSMDKLIKHLLPYNEALVVLSLNDNQMEELPHFLNGTFPRMHTLSLARNKIEKIDIETFRDLITRKDLVINVAGNEFPCDCHLYHFKTFLEYHYMRNWGVFKATMNMKCKYKDENKTEPMYSLTEDICRSSLDWRRVDWWLLLNCTLGLLNVITICLILDLICILTDTNSKERRPMMDRVICAFRCTSFRRSMPDSALDDVDGTVFGY